jgi:hypothetical protein
MGLDLNQDIAYTLFSSIKILVREGTISKYDSKEIKGQSIVHKMKIVQPNDKMTVYIELNWQGHYNEPKYTMKLPLINAISEINLFYNPKTRTWKE